MTERPRLNHCDYLGSSLLTFLSTHQYECDIVFIGITGITGITGCVMEYIKHVYGEFRFKIIILRLSCRHATTYLIGLTYNYTRDYRLWCRF